MDKNTFTGLILIFIIVGASVFLMQPSDDQIMREQALQDSLARVKRGELVDHTQASDTAARLAEQRQIVDSAVLKSPFGGARYGEEVLVTLENELIRATISSKGGRVRSVELKNEQTYD